MALYYTTLADAKTYLQRDGSDWSSLTEGMLEICEDDTDIELGINPKDYTSGTLRGIDTANITDLQKKLLAEAVAEQARFRSVLPAQHFVVPERERVSQDGVSFEGKVGTYSPRASERLSRAGLYQVAIGGRGQEPSYDEMFPVIRREYLGFPWIDDGNR